MAAFFTALLSQVSGARQNETPENNSEMHSVTPGKGTFFLAVHQGWPLPVPGHCYCQEPLPCYSSAWAETLCSAIWMVSMWNVINTDGQLLPTIVGNSIIPLLAASSCRLKSHVSDQNTVRMWQVQCMLLASVKKVIYIYMYVKVKRKNRLVPLLLLWAFCGQCIPMNCSWRFSVHFHITHVIFVHKWAFSNEKIVKRNCYTTAKCTANKVPTLWISLPVFKVQNVYKNK